MAVGAPRAVAPVVPRPVVALPGALMLVGERSVDDVAPETTGSVVNPPVLPLTGAGPADAYEIIPIERAMIAKVTGAFIRENLNTTTRR